MKKKSSNDADIVGIMNKIQAQLAVLDRKLDAFMTKSLTELAQAKVAASKPAHQPYVPPTNTQSVRPPERPARQMFAVVCFECGKDTEIPFKPTPGRAVYCKECFAKRRSANAPKVSDSAPSMAPVAPVAEAKPAGKKKAVAKKAPAKKAAVKKSAKRK